MSDVYAAYGPLPSSLGVTPSPTPIDDSEYRTYRHIQAQQTASHNELHVGRHHRSATLGRSGNPTHRRRSRANVAKSQQDLRRSVSRAAMERTPEPLQLLETLDSLDSTAVRLRGSLQKLDSPVYMDRKRNGSAISSATLASTYSTTFSVQPTSPLTRRDGSTVFGSKLDIETNSDETLDNTCCFRSMCCKIFFSLTICILILIGVVTALYSFMRYTPYEAKRTTEIDTFDPCSTKRCQYGAICTPSQSGKTAQCQCPTDCFNYGHSLVSSTVCASDGKNYENECQLLKTSCYQKKPLSLRYKGTCDPCEDVGCPDRHVCQLDRDRRPMCRCNDICSREFDPVCASDGKTYMNECIMKLEGCKRRRPLSIIYRGECSGEVNPCGSKVCLPGEECNIDVFGIARCECPTPCEAFVRPVCGSDGRTYDTHCDLLRNVCLKQENITISYVGVCGEEGPCINHPCEFGAVCIERPGRAECECADCPAELDPVCASDGLSYDNECLLKAEACRQHREITIRYRGKCSGCEDKLCNFYGVCEANENEEGACVCPEVCPNVESPVCGTDGETYLNECYLKVASCKKQKLIMVASRGDCDLCKHVVCKYGARCESGECICPTSCLTSREPVCASNGVTYLNECEMQKASCRIGRGALRVVFFGECSEAAKSSGITGSDPCTIMSCDYGSNCVLMPDGLPRCTCTLDCTDSMKDPVCASDLKMYPNECTMNREACQRQIELRLRPLELCEDYELVPCNGAGPIVNPVTGRDFYCGEGPDKEDCPTGSYCHWSLSFAKCCPMNDDINITITSPTCKSSQFGCCPDGMTSSFGPNYAGCPSICQCHKLGAYEETCDPITNQCRCKPGVGGTKCDRCEPGYWGLPQIQHGTNGCQPCACSLFGSVRDDCEQMTGQCVCKPGIGGKKCNMCPDNLVLGPKGCGLVNQSPSVTPITCSDLECYFGAVCHIRDGHAECLCDAQCPSDSSSATPVCGSDQETYGSECHLKLYACRYQKDVVVDALGPCPPLGNQSDVTESPIRRSTAPLSTEPHRDDKSTRHLLPEYFLMNGPMTSSLSNSILRPTPVSFRVFGLLGSLCYRDKDCSVGYSHCEKSQCSCKKGFASSTNHQACIVTTPGREAISISPCAKKPCKYGGTCRPLPGGSFTCSCPNESSGPLCENIIRPPYQIPSFGGKSYLELKKIKAYNKVQIELEFRSFIDNGLLVYSQQNTDGSGDYISVAIIDGYVEFRYDLGSGAAIIRTHHKITPKKFHKVIAKRYQRDGMLQLDNYEGSMGQATGHLKSLDLRGSTFLGFFKNASNRVFENIGTSQGLVGCIRAMRVNGRPIDLMWPGSPHITDASSITECSSSPCYTLPCLNQGTCAPIDDVDYVCACAKEFSGKRCEIRKSPCENNPCQNGGTCNALPLKGFVCRCPPWRAGLLCDKLEAALKEIIIPEFTGDSFLEFPTLESIGKSFAIEVWFYPKSPNGVLVYNGQNKEAGDFISINIKNGIIEFSYNLGSGLASLKTKETIMLNTWQVVRVKRKKRRGILQLSNGRKVRGKSGPRLTQLNLDQPLYVGGVRNLSHVNPDAGITGNFVGAIQRIIINADVIEELREKANGGQGIKRYFGAPCSHHPCLNGGICKPFLNRFTCICHDQFVGKFCERLIDENEKNKPIKFDGVTFLDFQNTEYSINTTNISYSEYWDHSLPQPWVITGLDYPSEYIDDTVYDDFMFLEGDVYDDDDEMDPELPEEWPQNFQLMNDEEELNYDYNLNPRARGLSTNHFEVRFRTASSNGLIIWMGKSSPGKDYMSLHVSNGKACATFNLGKQKVPLQITTKTRVDDGEWHKIVVHRRKRLLVLRLDYEEPLRTATKKSSKYLNTNGNLWIGGTTKLPKGLPTSYYVGFKGCIKSIEIEHRRLNFFSHSKSKQLKFCDPIP